MYVYYKEVEKEEHMLYLKEILTMYPIYSSSGKPHEVAMRALLNHVNTEKLYFKNRYGLSLVYPSSVYLTVIKFLEEEFNKTENNTIKIKIEEKEYTIKKR